MRLLVVSMFDKGAAAYAPPFVVASPGQAVRSFIDHVNDVRPDNVVAKHPDDFELYQLGFFDDASGRFENVENAPALLLSGSAAKRSA